jgi:hypothetical protein
MPRDDIGSYYGGGANEGFSGLPSYEQILANLGIAAPTSLSEFAAPSQNWGDPSWGTWGGGKSFRAPTEFEIARGSMPDSAKGAENDFAPSQQNAMLLNSLGFGGQALQNGAWTREALDWLNGNGYSLGVGHARGSESGGRPEYWGLIDSAGKYVQGQADPTMTISDTPMEIATPFLMMLPAIAGIVAAGAGAAGGGAGAAGAGGAGGAGASGGIGSLGAAESGLTSLGSAWSPQSLGLAGGITPGVSAAEIASLSAALPELGAAGAAAGGGLLSGGGSGVTQLGAGMSPEALGLTQAITPGVSAGELSALSQALPGAVGGGGIAADQAFQQAADEALQTSGNYYQQSPTQQWMTDVSNVAEVKGGGLLDYASSAMQNTPTIPGASSVKDLLGTASNAVGGGSNLAGLIGAVAGAADSGGTNTATTQSQIDPRMQQYLYGSGVGDPNSFLGAAQKLWQDNRSGINPTMQQGLDMQRSALQDPAYAQAYQQMRTTGQGLLNQPMAGNPFGAPQGATAQAGGPGGLLGGAPSDRARSLISRGRGLLG